jgi:transposase
MRSAYQTDLSDAECSYVEPHVPTPKAPGRPRLHTPREILDAIFYIVRSGYAWRLLPHDFPPWKTVHHYFRTWRIDGTWQKVAIKLLPAGEWDIVGGLRLWGPSEGTKRGRSVTQGSLSSLNEVTGLSIGPLYTQVPSWRVLGSSNPIFCIETRFNSRSNRCCSVASGSGLPPALHTSHNCAECRGSSSTAA